MKSIEKSENASYEVGTHNFFLLYHTNVFNSMKLDGIVLNRQNGHTFCVLTIVNISSAINVYILIESIDCCPCPMWFLLLLLKIGNYKSMTSLACAKSLNHPYHLHLNQYESLDEP